MDSTRWLQSPTSARLLWPGDGPGRAFVSGDTLLVFCEQTASEDGKLVPNAGSALLQTADQFVVRSTGIRCSCPSCLPYPTAYYTQGGREQCDFTSLDRSH